MIREDCNTGLTANAPARDDHGDGDGDGDGQ